MLFRVAADTGAAAAGQDARFAVARLTQNDVGLLPGIYADGKTMRTSRPECGARYRRSVPWVEVYDGRPESVRRRTARRPTEKLAGARILLLGCGGLGAPIAEHCVRSGAARAAHRGLGHRQPGRPVATAL